MRNRIKTVFIKAKKNYFKHWDLRKLKDLQNRFSALTPVRFASVIENHEQ
jgi:hypothetical protein